MRERERRWGGGKERKWGTRGPEWGQTVNDLGEKGIWVTEGGGNWEGSEREGWSEGSMLPVLACEYRNEGWERRSHTLIHPVTYTHSQIHIVNCGNWVTDVLMSRLALPQYNRMDWEWHQEGWVKNWIRTKVTDLWELFPRTRRNIWTWLRYNPRFSKGPTFSSVPATLFLGSFIFLPSVSQPGWRTPVILCCLNITACSSISLTLSLALSRIYSTSSLNVTSARGSLWNLQTVSQRPEMDVAQRGPKENRSRLLAVSFHFCVSCRQLLLWMWASEWSEQVLDLFEIWCLFEKLFTCIGVVVWNLKGSSKKHFCNY